MKTTQKQQETNKQIAGRLNETSETMTVEGTKKTNGKKNNGKRIHSRSFYMAINPKGGAMANKKQLPVFWKKTLAKEVANKVNGKAVRVTMTWQ